MKISWAICLILIAGTTAAHGELFEADSKRHGNPKMDIVLKEIERRPRSSVVDIKVTSVGSSVGSSFFLLCSIRQLALLRGNYHYVVKLEETPKRGQMLVGFLRDPAEKLSDVGVAFAQANPPPAVIDLDQFAEICGFAK